MWKVAAVLALLIAAVLAGWFFIGTHAPYEDAGTPTAPRDQIAVPPLPSAADTAPPDDDFASGEGIEALPQEPSWILPALNQSDPFVREQLTAIGAPERLVGQEELVRRFAVVVENAARGEYPRRQLAFLAPPGQFAVVERGDSLVIDPASYARYDGLVDALEAVDPRQLGRLLAFVMPLVDEALAELGAAGDARSLMAAGVARVLDVPVVAGEIEVVRPNVFFLYADPALEQRGAVQKLLLRTGPTNVQRVQAWVRRFAGVMELPPGSPALP